MPGTDYRILLHYKAAVDGWVVGDTAAPSHRECCVVAVVVLNTVVGGKITRPNE